MKNTAKRTAITGMLGALALVLQLAEGLIPPLPGLPPGAKPGLSNIVTMFCADFVGFPYAMGVSLIKGTFAIMTRGVTAGCMSLAGGIFSTATAWILLKKTKLSFMTVGMICAFMHNLGQFFVAMYITGVGVIYYIPGMLIVGLVSGALTGMLFGMGERRIKNY
ncbi:MAG: Gx transporter family protein [Clostridia bacterium]|nr:Gx transporter family protein [Clostridia bacterium]